MQNSSSSYSSKSSSKSSHFYYIFNLPQSKTFPKSDQWDSKFHLHKLPNYEIMEDKHSSNFLLTSKHRLSKRNNLIHIGYNLDFINNQQITEYSNPISNFNKHIVNSTKTNSNLHIQRNYRNLIHIKNINNNLISKQQFLTQSESVQKNDQSKINSLNNDNKLHLNNENILISRNAHRTQNIIENTQEVKYQQSTDSINIATLNSNYIKLEIEKSYGIVRNEVLNLWKYYKVVGSFNKSFIDFITKEAFSEDSLTFFQNELNKIYSKTSSFILINQNIFEREKYIINLKGYAGSLAFSDRELIGTKIFEDITGAFNHVRQHGLEIVENLINIRSNPFISAQINFGKIQVFVLQNDENYLCKMVSDLVFLSSSPLSKYFNFSPGFDPFLYQISCSEIKSSNLLNFLNKNNTNLNFIQNSSTKKFENQKLNFGRSKKFIIPISQVNVKRIKIGEKIIQDEFNINFNLPETFQNEINNYLNDELNVKPKEDKIFKPRKMMTLSKNTLKILDVLTSKQPIESRISQMNESKDLESKASSLHSKTSSQDIFVDNDLKQNKRIGNPQKNLRQYLKLNLDSISSENESHASPNQSVGKYSKEFPLISINHIESENVEELELKPLKVDSSELLNSLVKYGEIIPNHFTISFNCQEKLIKKSKEGICPQWIMYEEESIKGLVCYHRKLDENNRKIVEILHASCCYINKLPGLLKRTIRNIWEFIECEEIICKINYLQYNNTNSKPNEIIENIFQKEGFLVNEIFDFKFENSTIMNLQRPISSFTPCNIQKDCLIIGINYLIGINYKIDENMQINQNNQKTHLPIKMVVLASLLNLTNLKRLGHSEEMQNIILNSNEMPIEIKKLLIKYISKVGKDFNSENKNQNSVKEQNIKWPNLSTICAKSFNEIVNFFRKLCPVSILEENASFSEFIGTKQKLNLNFKGYIYEKKNLNEIDYNYLRIWSNFLYSKDTKFEAIKFSSDDNHFSLIIIKDLQKEYTFENESSQTKKSDQESKYENKKDHFEINLDNIIWKEGIIEEALLPSFNVDLNSDELVQNFKIDNIYLKTIWSKISLSMLSEKILPFNLQYTNSQSTFIIEDEFKLYIISNKFENKIDIPIISMNIKKSYWHKS